VKLKRILAVAASLLGEVLAFLLALLVVMRLVGDSLLWWTALVILGAVYLAVGAAPTPWARYPMFLGITAFLVPLVIFGWIGWRIEYFLRFEHVGAWENLPRVVLTSANLGTAVFLAFCAIVGNGVARRIRGRTSARVARQSQPSDRR
jgi:hypothetical protein